MKLDRRRFLALTFAAGAGIAATVIARTTRVHDPVSSPRIPSTGSSVPPDRVPASLLAIGRRYVDDYAGGTPDRVRTTGLDGFDATRGATLSEVVPAARRDFDAFAVVLVDGWVLADSEARALALLDNARR